MRLNNHLNQLIDLAKQIEFNWIELQSPAKSISWFTITFLYYQTICVCCIVYICVWCSIYMDYYNVNVLSEWFSNCLNRFLYDQQTVLFWLWFNPFAYFCYIYIFSFMSTNTDIILYFILLYYLGFLLSSTHVVNKRFYIYHLRCDLLSF